MLDKRLVDIVFSLSILIIFAPILAVCSILILIEDGRPVLFKQKRVGIDNNEFYLYKLRSMKTHDLSLEQVGQVYEGHPLVTCIGKWIRRLKIDELPQLVNVLKGDMSLVGPRPTVREQVDNYSEFQLRRLLMKPGITGWAQINGNTKLRWPERITLDIWYIMHWSLLLDISILAKTMNTCLFGEKINNWALKEAGQHEAHFNRNNN